jgi:hypothetical protein
MNSYNPVSIRSNIAAALCTVIFSATCLIGTLAPAQAAAAIAPSAVVSSTSA